MRVNLKLFIMLCFIAVAQNMFGQELKGSIRGKVLDAENLQPLIGVNVMIAESQVGCTTDLDGNYEIPKVKVGSYSIVYSYIGYEKITTTDVIVRSERITYANVSMKPSSIDMKSIDVTAGYFTQTEVQPLSAVNFSFEEIRRAPGAAGDVSRIIFGLQSR